VTDLRAQLQSALGSAYTLERELGGGGMSRVFVARDESLARDVVVKLLSPELSASLSAERFTREIKLAAALQEPHIVPVLTAGLTAEGLPYYTMPYVRGDSLRARLVAGPVPAAEALGLLRNIAQALAYAHERGIVHRDIKPENVLLSRGTAVVTDFGIAKALSASTTSVPDNALTSVGMSIGTPAYMAPEQAVGDARTDARADLYAWGVVAYEVLSGVHPFAKATTPHAMVAAHISELPRALRDVRPEISATVCDVVMQCLAKDPAQRVQSADALLARLANVVTPSAEALKAPHASSAFNASNESRASDAASAARVTNGNATPTRSTTWRVWASAAVVVAVLAGVYVVRSGDTATDTTKNPTVSASGSSAGDSTMLSSLAVLPFVNTGGDPKDEYFSDGLTDELAHALSKLPGLRLAGRSSSFSFKGKTILAPDVGKALGVGAIVEGTVRRAGDRIRLTAQLTSTRDGQVLWSDAFERSGSDVFAVQDAFTSAIVSALTPRLGQAPGVSAPIPTGVATRGTNDAEAYDLYLKGRYFWAQRGAGPGDSSVKYLEAAVQRDRAFARGWAGLALAHVIRPNYNSAVDFAASDARAKDAASRALALDSTIADAYVALGFRAVRRLEFAAASEAFAAARRLEPGSAIAAHWSAIYYQAVLDTLQADRQIELALTLDPLSATTFNTRAAFLSERRQFARSMENHDRVHALNPAFPNNSVTALVWSGLADSAYRVSRRSLNTQARGRFGTAVLAAAAAQEWTVARTLRDQIASGAAGVSAYDRAIAAAVFGNRAEAARYFVDVLENGGALANVGFSVCSLPFDAVRAEPAWKALLQRHGLKECPYPSSWPIGAVPR
jgi:serine/threonine-protein kinase